jgi:hypothetical protein
MRVRYLGVVLLTVMSMGCLEFMNAEGGFAAPVDPGTVLIRVRDQAGKPVAGVQATVEVPNDRGGLFKIGRLTGNDGSARIPSVPAGERRVEIAQPAGFADGERSRDVVVVKGRTTTVDFTLVRQ